MTKEKLIKRQIYFLSALLLIFTCSSSTNINTNNGSHQVKNIILIIGDGMGLTQVYAAMVANKQKLNIERAQFFGFSKTYSASDYTTDSGAGATAMSTGKKTYNTAIAIDTNEQPLKTIMEYASDAGLSTGIVVTCELTHATPAAFITHNILRYNYNEITSNFLSARFDILIGGGAHRFDSLGVTISLKKKGCQVVYSIDSINTTTADPLLCLAASLDLPSYLNGRGDYLQKSVKLALDKLDNNKKGFFLMIEGSQIDWGGHSNNLDYVVSEVIDLDRAIGEAFKFADKNPGTLVIITADHETGGLTLPLGNISSGENQAVFSTVDHTGVMVPIYAYGNGAENFSQIMDNTDIFYMMMKVLGLSAK